MTKKLKRGRNLRPKKNPAKPAAAKRTAGKSPETLISPEKKTILPQSLSHTNGNGNGVKTTVKHIMSHGSDLGHRFVADYKELDKIVNLFKEMGYKVVLTQGVYDLIHEGHAAYLEAAKAQGDILIVGVDSDELTKIRKGPDRPIVPEDERLKMLVHLRHVDLVTLRHAKDDIGHLIRLVKPDVLVVSQSTTDFTTAMAQEYTPFCGEIVTLPPQATTSTSARIRNLTIEGAEKLAKKVSELTSDFLNEIRKK